MRLTDDDAVPRITRVARHADPALPRRRHLLRGQYRRFPNRFFDTVVDMTAGRRYEARWPAGESVPPGSEGPLLARSARLDLVRVTPSVAGGALCVELAAVGGPGTAAFTVPLGLGARLPALLPGIPVGEPETLAPAEVVAWAGRLHPRLGSLREAALARDGHRQLSLPDGVADGREPA